MIQTHIAPHFKTQCTQISFSLLYQPQKHSKTLVDNIFSNNIEDGLISGNITTNITDHYVQFLLKKDIILQHTNQ